MVWPSPQGISANKSVLGFAIRFSKDFKSLRKFLTLSFQAAAVGGASVDGQ